MTCNILINGMFNKDKIDEAVDFVNNMVSKRHELNVMDYIFLINGLWKNCETYVMDYVM